MRGASGSGSGRALPRPAAESRRPVSPPRRAGVNPRALALEILRRVETTGAYANLLLDARLRGSGLGGPDRALATELVYGVLRWRGKLDWILTPRLDRRLEALDPAVRHLLRLGAYQLRCLDRIPDFAAVDETVGLARACGAGRSAGYINAVLRAVARRTDGPEPDPAADPVRYWGTLGSHPEWLAARWIARLGPEEAGQLMAANNAVPPLTLMVNRLRAGVEEARRALEDASIEVAAGRWAPGALTLRGAGSPADLPGFADGVFLPMDEAGALPVLALELAPGQRVLDACAGGGSKGALIAAAVGPAGEVVALDRSPRAVRRLETAVRRLGCSRVRPHLGDARAAGAKWPGAFPRVLLDAPCTGLGTIRRRPEIKWRRRPDDLERMAALQQELLAGVAPAVAPGGLLVYSTCSLEPEETDAVVAAFLASRPEFTPADISPEAGDALSVPGAFVQAGWLRAWPHRHGTDSFFVARFRRAC